MRACISQVCVVMKSCSLAKEVCMLLEFFLACARVFFNCLREQPYGNDHKLSFSVDGLDVCLLERVSRVAKPF